MTCYNLGHSLCRLFTISASGISYQAELEEDFIYIYFINLIDFSVLVGYPPTPTNMKHTAVRAIRVRARAIKAIRVRVRARIRVTLTLDLIALIALGLIYWG